MSIFTGINQVFLDVLIAISPLFILFIVFQFLFFKLPWKRVKDILVGFALSIVGLGLFLQGVNIGFLPVGEAMGEIIGSFEHKWLLIPIGFILGFFTVIAEPSVTVLINQVDKASSGYIPRNLLKYTICIGVGIATSLTMVRIIYGFSLLYIVVPGYLLAIIMALFTPKTFASIAFDSGAVATGPMTSTFLLAPFVGIASSIAGRDPVLDGFGMVITVLLAPIISVLTLGLLYGRKEKAMYEQQTEEKEQPLYAKQSAEG